MESLNGCRIISLVGPQGSGKSTIGQRLSSAITAPHIEASEFAKKITGTNVRSELPGATEKFTAKDPDWLGRGIELRIKELAKDLVILTGVRERNVHLYLASQGANIYIYELDAPMPLRYDRLLSLKKVSNADEFIRQELREMKLGVWDVCNDATYRIPNDDDTSTKEIARAIAKSFLGATI